MKVMMNENGKEVATITLNVNENAKTNVNSCYEDTSIVKVKHNGLFIEASIFELKWFWLNFIAKVDKRSFDGWVEYNACEEGDE